MQIEADPRLAAAAGGAARYFADAAGLEGAAMTDWQAAIVAACKEAFEHLTPEHAQLSVTLTRLADRLEVALSRENDTSQAGAHAGKSEVLEGVDRVQFETQGGVAVTRLTKYITSTAPRR
jgi:hypothetical protein